MYGINFEKTTRHRFKEDHHSDHTYLQIQKTLSLKIRHLEQFRANHKLGELYSTRRDTLNSSRVHKYQGQRGTDEA
jgi:hypothetical protein